jgi:hypothetical protein
LRNIANPTRIPTSPSMPSPHANRRRPFPLPPPPRAPHTTTIRALRIRRHGRRRRRDGRSLRATQAQELALGTKPLINQPLAREAPVADANSATASDNRRRAAYPRPPSIPARTGAACCTARGTGA